MKFEAMGIGVVILAAGSSSRLGSPKQLVLYRGQSLIRHAAEAALGSVCDHVVVVVGSHAQEVTGELAGLAVLIVENGDWQSGMSSSIRTGLEAVLAKDEGVYGVVIMLCDQPFVTADVLDELVSTHRDTGRSIVASAYGATNGVPAFFSRDLFAEIASLTADEGARRIIAAHPDKVATIMFAQGVVDIDSPQDLQRLQIRPQI